MKKVKHFLIIGFVLVILIIAGFVLNKFFPIKPTQSASTDNVSGWAWGGGDDGVNAGNGWISFNCTDPRPGAPGGVCGSSNYGVTVNPSTGDFSGYAWAGGGVDAAGNLVPTLGWISFNRTDAGNPPFPPYNTGSGPIANFDFVSKRVRGWAKALAADGNGWDGWIKLGDDSGTWPAGGSQVYVQTQAGPDELRGWAWGSDVVGWISFNCLDRAVGFCAGTSNYKVLLDINFPPTVTCNNIGLCQNPPWNCCSDSRHPILTWTFNDPDGDTQAAYQVQIDVEGSSDFIPPVKLDHTAPPPNDSKSYTVSPAHMVVSGDDMQWGQTYSWRVLVQDSRGSWSPTWAVCTVVMPSHAYPTVDFNWSPQKPSAKENVQFTDKSKCYDDVIGGSPCTHPKYGGNDSFSWTFIGPGTVNYDDPLTLTLEFPMVSFSNPGSWDVKLEVTDSGGFMCPNTKSVKVSYPLPSWEEIIPK